MSDLDRLFYWRGIAADFFNYRGEHVQVSLENRAALLKAMGVDINSTQVVADAAYKLDVAPWLQWFPSLMLEREGPESGFFINLHPAKLNEQFSWTLTGENFFYKTGDFSPLAVEEIGDYLFEDTRFTRRKIYIPDLKPGYYRLDVKCSSGKKASTTLAVAPSTAYVPDYLLAGEKSWGVIVQLYTLRSGDDWGIGDFTVLKDLVRHLSALGADTIGLNPFHALLPELEHKYSPYSPSDRRFLCTLYIDPCVLPEFKKCIADESKDIGLSRNKTIEQLRESSHVKYVDVANVKYAVFEKMFKQFLADDIENRTARGQEFLEYCVSSGDVLKLFALFEGVCNCWQNATYVIDIAKSDLEKAFLNNEWSELAERYQSVLLFHSYLQWVAHAQLGVVQRFAKASGMKLGLIRDLAVGADGSGAEVTSNPELFCRKASVGAPPDPLAEQGQNWGLPPMDPAALRKTGFAHYINLLRENMSLCGALRIDHAMSMMRLWWCPPGETADHGAYVYYPFEEMIGLLTLESQRNKCLIIGEDLGVVPDDFRNAMKANHIYSNKVFYFERASYNRFKNPSHYETNALAMINNHDVPTLTSWWNGSDLILREKLNIFEEGVTFEQMVEQRKAEKYQVFDLLEECNLLPSEWGARNVDNIANESLINAVLVCGALTASKIYVIQLEDLVGMDSPVNVPGTYLEHANWQRKITRTIGEIFENQSTLEVLKKINLARN